MVQFFAISLLTVYSLKVCLGSSNQDRRGPVFTYEPPSRVKFSNTTGTVVPCSAEGIPAPTIRWAHALDGSYITDVPGLRHMRPDGSLVFPPFRAEDQRPDVHTTAYRCIATNSVGSIGSRDVSVKGVAGTVKGNGSYFALNLSI